MFIVWSGLGFLTAVIPMVLLYGVDVLFEAITGTTMYENPMMVIYTVIVASIIIWFLGQRLNRNQSHLYKDENTGETVRIDTYHTLFWIRMEYWAFILPILALFATFF